MRPRLHREADVGLLAVEAGKVNVRELPTRKTAPLPDSDSASVVMWRPAAIGLR